MTGSAKFEERVSSIQPAQDFGKQRPDQLKELLIANVATAQPDDGNVAFALLPAVEKILVLVDQCATPGLRQEQNLRVFRKAQSQVLDVNGVASSGREKARKRRRKLRIDNQPHGLRGVQHRMIHRLRCKIEAGFNVLAFEVGIVGQNLIFGCAGREQFQHIDDPNAHPPNARASAALVGIESDARKQFRIHGGRLRAPRSFASASFFSIRETYEDFVHLYLKRRRMSL